MRIVRSPKPAKTQAEITAMSADDYDKYAKEAASVSQIVKFGYEDIIIVIVLVVITVGYLRGQLSISEFLGYLGVSGTGGLWGVVSGTASDSQGQSTS